MPTGSLAQDFVIDDSVFAEGAENDAGEEHTRPFPALPDGFRIELSHQAVGHVNHHAVEAGQQQETRERALEVNRLGSSVRYQNLFDNGWLLQGSGRLRLYLPGDYEYRNSDRSDYEIRLDELFVQRSGTEHSVTLGRQTIVWGETVGNSVLDVINTSEYRDLTVIDLEDARQNQWLAAWDWYGGTGTLSGFVNLYPEFNPLPVEGSPLLPSLPYRLPTFRRDSALFEAGVRWSHSFAGSDVAVMAAHLYENDVAYLPPPPGERNARPVINDHLLFGLSANRAIGRLLLTMDVAYSPDVLATFRAIDAPPGALPAMSLEGRDRLAASAGMEYAISTTRQISASISAAQLRGSDREAGGTGLLVDSGSDGNVLLRYSENRMNDNLLLSLTAQRALDGSLGLLQLAADWRITDAWSVTGQLILTRAEADSPLPHLDEDVRLGITTRLSF